MKGERKALPRILLVSYPKMRKEITDVFEYLLLQSGRLILHVSSERSAVALENVPFITRKEKALTHLLGTLQVAVRTEVQDATK